MGLLTVCDSDNVKEDKLSSDLFKAAVSDEFFFKLKEGLDSSTVITIAVMVSNLCLTSRHSCSERENTFSGIPAHFVQSGQRTPWREDAVCLGNHCREQDPPLLVYAGNGGARRPTR